MTDTHTATSDIPSDAFLLNVPITRPDVVEWLQTVPSDKLTQVVENTLAAGNLVLSLLQASTGEESMQRFFRPVLEPMRDLKSTIEGILRATQKSQRLGELGEAIVSEQLKSAFPGDDFQVVAAQEHQADIHASFTVSNDESHKALIEVKFYSDDVPRQEIEKFRRDLDQTGFRFGLMVSLTSRLTGIAGPLHLEETPSYIAVYLPNAGVDGHRLLCAAAMLKAIVLFQARTNATRLVSAASVEQAWARLSLELQELKEITDDVRDLKNSLQAAQQNLATIFGKATEKAISAECRLRYAVDRITNRLAEELFSLPKAAAPISLLPPTEPDEVLVFIQSLRAENDPRLRAFEGIHDLCQRLSLQIRLSESHWQLLRDGRIIAYTGGTRTRVDVSLPINADESTRIRPTLEKIKNDCIIIDGSAVEQMLTRLEQRLGADPFAE